MYDNHPADIASELFEREKDLRLRDDARAILRMVDRAIERAGLGTYGSCERCGREIDEGRLQAIPYAALCSACQRESERRMPPRPARPAEEGFIGEPFGAHITDGRSAGIDGEDVWRAVARYGTASSPQDVPGLDEREEGSAGVDIDRDAVEETDLIIAADPDEIPPDPAMGRRTPERDRD